MNRVALLALLAACPAAAEVLVLPATCSPILSVQHRECVVTIYWECDGEDGYSSADVTQDGIGWITVRGAGGQWLRMTYLPTNFTYLPGDTPDPSDHRIVLSEGADTYVYTMTSGDGLYSETYTGTNTLGDAVTIDGEDLRAVRYDYIVTDPAGTPVRALTGTAYFWGERPISIPGPWQGDHAMSSAAEPVEILTEGEPGFMDTTPKYDCGEEMS